MPERRPVLVDLLTSREGDLWVGVDDERFYLMNQALKSYWIKGDHDLNKNNEQIGRELDALRALGATSVLFVDDNSPDGTGAIIDAMCAEDERVHAHSPASWPSCPRIGTPASLQRSTSASASARTWRSERPLAMTI